MNQFDKLSYRYVAETILATALFVATSYWARDFLEEQRSLAFHLLVSFLATSPLILALWAQVRYFRRVDERERRIFALAGIVTLPVAVLLAIFLAKLEHVITVDLDVYGSFLVVFWSAATVWARQKI
ncbi:hypothetical protein [Roseibium album]|uniref:hypothetical protein n=1 Tax=Roseibium album TaxID=311410 RepID=UPI0018CA1306|nr:ethanolamine transporter EutH [Labrenzia sp. EL_162]MBG6195008.1 ethanolamine transporter EutH [Labrenzia sp. EL_159]